MQCFDGSISFFFVLVVWGYVFDQGWLLLLYGDFFVVVSGWLQCVLFDNVYLHGG